MRQEQGRTDTPCSQAWRATQGIQAGPSAALTGPHPGVRGSELWGRRPQLSGLGLRQTSPLPTNTLIFVQLRKTLQAFLMEAQGAESGVLGLSLLIKVRTSGTDRAAEEHCVPGTNYRLHLETLISPSSELCKVKGPAVSILYVRTVFKRVTCPKSHSWEMEDLRFESRSLQHPNPFSFYVNGASSQDPQALESHPIFNQSGFGTFRLCDPGCICIPPLLGASISLSAK